MNTTSAPWSPPATPRTRFTDDLVRNLRHVAGDYNLRLSSGLREETSRLAFKIEADPGSPCPVCSREMSCAPYEQAAYRNGFDDGQAGLNAAVAITLRKGIRTGIEASAGYVDGHVLVTSSHDAHPSYFGKRKGGNRHGLEYAEAIRALADDVDAIAAKETE